MRKHLNSKWFLGCWQLVASIWKHVALKSAMLQIIYQRIVIEWPNMNIFANKLIYNRIHI